MGTTRRDLKAMFGASRTRLAAISAALIACLSITASSASAQVVEPIVYSGESFNGSGSTAGTFDRLEAIAIDTAHRRVYTAEVGHGGSISRFDMAGVAAPFSGLAGASSIDVGDFTDFGFVEFPALTVDNSAGSAGAFYALLRPGMPIMGFGFDGQPKSGFPTQPSTSSCGIAADPQGDLWFGDRVANRVFELSGATGAKTGAFVNPIEPVCYTVIDSEGNFYVAEAGFGGETTKKIWKFDPTGALLYRLNVPNPSVEGYELNIRELSVDPSSNHVYVVVGKDYSGYTILEYTPNNPDPIEEIFVEGIEPRKKIAVDGVTHDIYVTSGNVVKIYKHQPPITVPDVTTDPVVPTPTTAELRGTINPDGIATTDCHFEWGPTKTYGTSVPCDQGDVLSGNADVHVTATVTGIDKGSSYHVRLVAKNSNGFVVKGKDAEFVGQDLPKFTSDSVTNVTTEGVTINARINPESGVTAVHVEYGPDTNYGSTAPVPATVLSSSVQERNFEVALTGLPSGSEFHYRIVATNAAGTTKTTDHMVKTFDFVPIDDDCPNQLARQQTGSALLLDCRAYELVSASDTGGYHVESDLTPGQEPFDGYPFADGKALYGIHNGGIPGVGEPTNHGLDAYLATRGDDGWGTEYVGIPAGDRPPFSSTLLGADETLDTFAFGGRDICDPCFEDGSGGIPVRLPDGSLIQGMQGGEDPGPDATADGLIKESLSDDGKHLVFGSTEAFTTDGNDETGDVSIYDRNLETGFTQVVSKTPLETNLPCLQGAGNCHYPSNENGIAELAISHDGSRIVVAQKVGTDASDNVLWHPYLHIGTSPETVDLAPGAITGVLFDGMTADGSRVFLTTRDKLLLADTDSSADIYEAEVHGTGPADLRLVTVESDESPSNDDACTPAVEWNVVPGDGSDCSAVAFAGGAGLASESGDFYFVSPEQLDGTEGLANEANLYLVEAGEAPEFVTVMDSSVGKPPPPPPSRPVINTSLISGLSTPEALAVNQNNGDIYVKERGTNTVARFHSDGSPHNFTAGPNAGTNRITGEDLGGPSAGQIAVDSHVGSLFENAFYVTSGNQANQYISVFAESGEKLGTVHATYMGLTCGVAVDQSTGVVYVASGGTTLNRLQPVSNATPVNDASYTSTVRYSHPFSSCQTAVDSNSNIYVSSASATQRGPVLRWDTNDFAAEPPGGDPGKFVAGPGYALYADHLTNELYVDAGGRIDVFDEAGQVKEVLAKGKIAGSRGVAVNVNTHHVYAVNGQKIIEVGYEVHPEEPVDNPAIRHGVRAAGTRDWSDFQVTADGHFAVFPSSIPITGFDSSNRLQVYRYDAEADEVDCASCLSTNATPEGGASLSSHGYSVSDDGRVFFTSSDALVLRDTDAKKDAYEWSDGVQQLISTGLSPFDSGLHSVTADGRDVFFFTRDVLAPEDHNGILTKLYDAREDGGFFAIPDRPPCAASDECHGPGTQAPAAANIGSVTGTPGNRAKKRCPKGKKRKKGKCVKAHKRRNHRRSSSR